MSWDITVGEEAEHGLGGRISISGKNFVMCFLQTFKLAAGQLSKATDGRAWIWSLTSNYDGGKARSFMFNPISRAARKITKKSKTLFENFPIEHTTFLWPRFWSYGFDCGAYCTPDMINIPPRYHSSGFGNGISSMLVVIIILRRFNWYASLWLPLHTSFSL
jgi:hypothetical protein